MPSKSEKIIWYAPKWSTNPMQWWVLRKYLLAPGPLARMAGATVFATLLIIAGFWLAFPGIVFPNLWPIVFALPVVIVSMVFQTAVLSLFRMRVLVTAKKILISHGQSGTLIRPATLNRVRLTVHENGKSRIRFDYAVKSKQCSKTVGLSDDCDLFKLQELLPVEILVRDARRDSSASSRNSANGSAASKSGAINLSLLN